MSSCNSLALLKSWESKLLKKINNFVFNIQFLIHTYLIISWFWTNSMFYQIVLTFFFENQLIFCQILLKKSLQKCVFRWFPSQWIPSQWIPSKIPTINPFKISSKIPSKINSKNPSKIPFKNPLKIMLHAKME